ncbi:MAG: DUF4860 domain-containing protein [Lachnospiraceae bacterium]|nr:DUF4860 domain-containing protein [Lachnospiraceae bacterium]
MKQRAKERHSIDFLFVLSLFGFFTITALAVVLIGLQVYRSTVTQMQDNYTAATALSYIAEKVRSCDESGSLQIAELEGQPALAIRQTVAEIPCVTYIYEQDGRLMELFVTEETPASLHMGEALTEVENFTVSSLEDGLFMVSLTDGARMLQLVLKPHSTPLRQGGY